MSSLSKTGTYTDSLFPQTFHKNLATAVRILTADAVEKAGSGHPGMPMGMADVATVLWTRFLRFDPTHPDWPDRDRFILSAGHGSMLMYALAYLAGYPKMTIEEIKNFRQLGSLTPGHPEHNISIGVENTSGPLGQGLAISVGFALAERILNARFGEELVNHRTFVIASDGDLMEGISHEAISLAGHLRLGRLIVFYDDNKISIDGPTSLTFSEDVQMRFRACGWHVQEIDGHNPEAIIKATETALEVVDKPSLISCRTIIGFGAPNKQNTSGCHGSPLGADEIAAVREQLGWQYPPFHIPEDILHHWREPGRRNARLREEWGQRYLASKSRLEFDRVIKGELPVELDRTILKLKQKISTDAPKAATRQSSGMVLAEILPEIPELIGGSADLTPSNNTKVKGYEAISAPYYKGRYIHYGVREHAMAAIMNGMALHGGIIPYGGTFLQFSDYCRPAIRLAALMKQRVIFVMTHDSIGLGEDGPTHQPVEHLASLRAIPGLLVFRPADGVETAECWQLALQNKNRPSLLALSRQGLFTIRLDKISVDNLCAKGAYVIEEAENGKRDVTLLATGSEVMLAIEARKQLQKEGIFAAVVSMPCWELFEEQEEIYRNAVLGSAPRIAIEAGICMGWERYIGDNGAFIGMSSFGASAPADVLYRHFGIITENIVKTAKILVGL